MILALLFFSSFSFANTRPLPCAYSFDMELLCFYPSLQDTYFAIESSVNENPNGPRKNVSPHPHLAFRLEGAYGLPYEYSSLSLSWMHLCSKDQNSVSGSNLFIVQIFEDFVPAALIGTITSDIQILVNDAALLYSYGFCFFPPQFELVLQGGVHFAYLQAVQEIEYARIEEPPLGNLSNNSQTWGVGPKIALESSYTLLAWNKGRPGTFSLAGSFAGSLLISKANSSIVYLPTNPRAEIQNRSELLLMPSCGAKLGLRTFFAFCGGSLQFEVGYEWITYLSALQRIIFLPLEPFSFTKYENLTLHGPYAALVFNF